MFHIPSNLRHALHTTKTRRNALISLALLTYFFAASFALPNSAIIGNLLPPFFYIHFNAFLWWCIYFLAFPIPYHFSLTQYLLPPLLFFSTFYPGSSCSVIFTCRVDTLHSAPSSPPLNNRHCVYFRFFFPALNFYCSQGSITHVCAYRSLVRRAMAFFSVARCSHSAGTFMFQFPFLLP